MMRNVFVLYFIYQCPACRASELLHDTDTTLQQLKLWMFTSCLCFVRMSHEQSTRLSSSSNRKLKRYRSEASPPKVNVQIQVTIGDTLVKVEEMSFGETSIKLVNVGWQSQVVNAFKKERGYDGKTPQPATCILNDIRDAISQQRGKRSKCMWRGIDLVTSLKVRGKDIQVLNSTREMKIVCADEKFETLQWFINELTNDMKGKPAHAQAPEVEGAHTPVGKCGEELYDRKQSESESESIADSGSDAEDKDMLERQAIFHGTYISYKCIHLSQLFAGWPADLLIQCLASC